MTDKERVSASVDPEVAAYLKQDHVNASGLINDLVSRHMNGGATDELLREFRIQQLEEEYKDAASTARRKLQQRNKLKQQEQQEITDRAADLREFVDWMDVNNEYVFADHERVADLEDRVDGVETELNQHSADERGSVMVKPDAADIDAGEGALSEPDPYPEAVETALALVEQADQHVPKRAILDAVPDEDISDESLWQRHIRPALSDSPAEHTRNKGWLWESGKE